MAANKVAVVLALVAVIVAVTLVAETEAATTCSPVALVPCAPAIMSNQKPSDDCCTKLRGQRSCLCTYLRNPALKQYINSPGAKRVASTCKVFVKC